MMMMRWMTWWVVSVVVLAAGGVGGAQTAPATTPRDYAILGLDSVNILTGVSVDSGDVGCNATGGAVTLMARSHVTSAVAGDTVRLGRRATAGELFCTKVEPAVAGVTCSPMTAPLVDTTSLPAVQVNPGSQDVKLARSASQTGLAPGAYGAVRIGERATLSLAGGEYDFRRVQLFSGAKLLCDAACTIRVADTMILGTGAQLGPAAAPLDATAVRVEIRGGSKTRAGFRTFRRSVVDANVLAPNGRIVLGMSGRNTGAFIGKAVFVYPRARITGLSAF